MTRWNFSHWTLSFSVAAALLASCGGAQPPIGAPGATPQASAIASRTSSSKYKVLFSFDFRDGSGPQELLNVNGTFYGTTHGGGARRKGHCDCGTVFSVTPSGTEKVLYRFVGSPDGNGPIGHLIDVNGTLYGTAYSGGTNTSDGCGTVFSVTTAGKERTLHQFAGGADGCRPEGGLVNVNGALYGITSTGGAYQCYQVGCGTVFSITTAGKKHKVYDFAAVPDGDEPVGPLLDVNGKLYGTTWQGGTGKGCEGSEGCGTVFSVTTAGKERVVYSFGGSRGDDGAYPNTSLLDVNGTLYGTTSQGGAPGFQSYSAAGTIFSVTTTGKEQLLHTFMGYADGAEPDAGLIRVNRKLYGTTQIGGIGSCRGSLGCGTVFSITTAGNYRIRHMFSGSPDGALPVTTLTNLKGTLYGTTSGGGANGFGTVFTLTP